MSTTTLHFTCNTRPVRLAFLVDKPDPDVLRQVFRLNTLLWGGALNPVVVLDGSSRKQVGVHYQHIDTPYEQELLLTLMEFDPDVVINYSNASLPATLNAFRERTFATDALRWNPWGNQEVSFFLEVWPFLRQYWRQEFRFLQKPPHKYGYLDPSSSGALATYLAARFGGYPDGSDGNGILADHFGGKPISYDPVFRKSFNRDEWVFPIQITELNLDVPAPDSHQPYIFFLFNPLEMFDVVDFWNLRAAGFHVSPLPIDHYQDFAESAKGFTELATYRINRNIENYPEIVKGRSIDDSQLIEAGNWLHSLRPNAGPFSLRGWVHRFGVRGHGFSPEVQVRPPVSKESSEIVVVSDGYGALQGPTPECEMSGPAFSQHWATDLQSMGAASEDGTFRLPWLHPECDKLAGLNVGRSFGLASARVSKKGLVVFRSGDREDISIREPKVTQVLRAYMKDGGLGYLKLSSPGLALERIVEQLGGLFSCGVLQNSGVRDIIGQLADGSSMPAEEVRKAIHRALPTTGTDTKESFENILSRLISKKVLRQGLELQCDKCQRRDWYHLTDLGEDFKCKKCFHVQLVPFLDKRPWHYVSDGLMRLEGRVAGCLTAILSLIFVQRFLSHGMKYVPSFEYTDGTHGAERDFAVLTSEFFQDDVDVIIGECKTSKGLEEKEKNDIRILGQRTGAYLAFATLSTEFTVGDKLFFEQLVESKQKPILLTRGHLEMPYLEISTYRHQSRGPGRDAEVLSRLTIIDVLGKAFASKHRIWP
jgi:hypothetical protein